MIPFRLYTSPSYRGSPEKDIAANNYRVENIFETLKAPLFHALVSTKNSTWRVRLETEPNTPAD